MSDELSQHHVRADRDHLIHGWHHPADHEQAKIWVKAQGSFISDDQGNTFIDGLAGLWNVLVGSGREELAQAAAEQMRAMPYASNHVGSSNPLAIELAERLAGLCYPAINHFFFTSGGSEANESALKAARFYWKTRGKSGKYKMISLKQGYHGVTLGAMSMTGLDTFSTDMFDPRPEGFIHIESPYPFYFNARHTPSASASTPGIAAANLLEEAILREGADTVAAFIAEPIQGGGGVIVPQEDYFPRIREICDAHEVLFIADEVITGFGRTGDWFALNRWGVVPDMVTFAKGVTSGYFPLGGLGLSDTIAEAINTVEPAKRFMHAYTYSGHPVGCAVALANLDLIVSEGLLEKAAENGAAWHRQLKTLLRHPQVGEIRGLGMLAAVEFCQDRDSRTRFASGEKVGPRIQQACAKRGLWSRVFQDTYSLAPPLSTEREVLERTVAILDEAIGEVFGG